jgi:hypothetical protein
MNADAETEIFSRKKAQNAQNGKLIFLPPISQIYADGKLKFYRRDRRDHKEGG